MGHIAQLVMGTMEGTPISVTPDSLLKTIKAIAEVEAKIPVNGEAIRA